MKRITSFIILAFVVSILLSSIFVSSGAATEFVFNSETGRFVSGSEATEPVSGDEALAREAAAPSAQFSKYFVTTTWVKSHLGGIVLIDTRSAALYAAGHIKGAINVPLANYIFTRKEGMGGGDIKLLAMIGAFLGWKAAVITFFLAPFLGIGVGVFNLVAKKDHLIPYGPFLSLAALLALFFQHRILHLFFLQ